MKLYLVEGTSEDDDGFNVCVWAQNAAQAIELTADFWGASCDRDTLDVFEINTIPPPAPCVVFTGNPGTLTHIVAPSS